MTALIIIGFLFFMLLFILWDMYKKRMKQRIKDENEYDMMRLRIQAFIDKEPSRAYFEYIEDRLIALHKLAWKDNEKTDVLEANFKRRYEDFAQHDDDIWFDFDQLDSIELNKKVEILTKNLQK